MPGILEMPLDLLSKVFDIAIMTSTYRDDFAQLPLVSKLFCTLVQPMLFEYIDIGIPDKMSEESFHTIRKRVEYLSSSKFTSIIHDILVEVQPQASSPLAADLLNLTFKKLSRFSDLSVLSLRNVPITPSVLRCIASSTTTSLTLDGCPTDQAKLLKANPDTLKLNLKHLVFTQINADIENHYSKPWWIHVINPSTIESLYISSAKMSAIFIEELASSHTPHTTVTMENLHTLQLSTPSTLSLSDLRCALSKTPALVNLDMDVFPTFKVTPTISLDCCRKLDIFDNTVPRLKTLTAHYLIVIRLCPGRRLRTVRVIGLMDERTYASLYYKLQNGSAKSLSGLSMETRWVTEQVIVIGREHGATPTDEYIARYVEIFPKSRRSSQGFAIKENNQGDRLFDALLSSTLHLLA
ncbi:hypothetical protein C8Q75DRAFT_803080 [Abortiporus biennis]|nr:hypothetical protein C8Q75DRAFT_803080 [Abortiporus biennis]